MADVNFFEAFGYKWALVGPAEILQDSQYKAGWGFIGAVPPSVEQFNRVHQVADEKANYLFGLLNSIAVAAGTPLTEASVNTIRDALSGRIVGNSVIAASASVAVPALARSAYVRLWAGGGGGGGMGNAGVGGGGGGGGGGYFEGFVTVTPGGTVVTTVGAGGAGGAAGGNNGGFGSASSFGGLASATGGSPGTGFASGTGAGGAGGAASGTGLTIAGSIGQNGIQTSPGGPYFGGAGGGSFGSSNTWNSVFAGPIGSNPGGGGAGGGQNSAGGAGRSGLIIVHWIS